MEKRNIIVHTPYILIHNLLHCIPIHHTNGPHLHPGKNRKLFENPIRFYLCIQTLKASTLAQDKMPVPTGVVKLKTRVLCLLTFQKVVPYIGGGGFKKLEKRTLIINILFFPYLRQSRIIEKVLTPYCFDALIWYNTLWFF